MEEQGEPQISLVSSELWVSEIEQGGYYSLGTVGVWMEVQVLERPSAVGTVGVRWTIDGWNSHHDTMGFSKSLDVEGALWRIEIPNLVSIGWRDGSIGGPNGEQPSGKVWTLWGLDRGGVSCLLWGSPVPAFEFALFMKSGERTNWNNNCGRNFRMELDAYGRKPGT